MSADVFPTGVLRQPGTVLFGPGERRHLPRLLAGIARHVLVVTDARMAGSAVFTDLVAAVEAEGLTVSVFSGTEPDLPRENALAVVREYGGAGVEALLAVGGGSCLDLAKVASAVLAHGGDVRDYYGEFLVPGPGLPVVTVPTTAGTGAEVTCVSVVFDRERGMKVGVASPHLEPYAAVIDPELTLTCPPALTAATAADALTHLVETFTDRVKDVTPEFLDRHLYVGKNPLTDIFCRSGLTLLNTSLEAVVADPSDIGARSATMLAAYNAGMAINTAGTAAAHAIQSPIGALTGTSHGFGVGALLPYVMRFNLPARVAEFAEIGRLLGAAAPGAAPMEQARAGISRVEELLETVGCPTDLRTLGLDPGDFSRVADQAMLATRLTANNPRDLTHASVVEILRRGYDNDRGWWSV
ncbi:iron-containing alcohol dehydrogenase [Streptomyces sp. SID8352]|uniref:iron-containing alcohol dehydrogenase n=1 Tax=Streptomyces sp. SID8352 TaxID=2690338 RepID=UPI0013700511|nr:iron-containing alcohol dehydrogenase [Streptomyces sp. SID8352]